MAHPAQAHVDASKKRQRDWIEGRARGGNVNRPGGIHIKPSHKGLLHKDLGVAAGKPIPEAKMERAKVNASPAEKKRIVFAENAKKWNR